MVFARTKLNVAPSSRAFPTARLTAQSLPEHGPYHTHQHLLVARCLFVWLCGKTFLICMQVQESSAGNAGIARIAGGEALFPLHTFQVACARKKFLSCFNGLCVSLCQVQAVESAFKVAWLYIAHPLTNANIHRPTHTHTHTQNQAQKSQKINK